MPKHAFEMVPLPAARSTEKPRRTGLTMMMDWGMPMGQLADVLDLVAPFVDLGKLVAGHARLYTEDQLVRKIELFQRHQVRPFLGGQFLEYVFATQSWQGIIPYCREVKRLGIEAIEVSDNCVPLTDDERRRMIAMVADTGVEVHGEVGSKDVKQTAADLIRQANICFDAGADVVLVEAAELMIEGEVQRDLLNALKNGLDFSRVIIELPGPWIKGTTLNDVIELQKFLVTEFGPDVNIANVQHDSVFNLEALRVGLSFVGPKTVLPH